MKIIENSLTIVLLGDWNKLYIQPDWVANNIFCKTEIEIGVEAQGIEFNVSYKCDDVVINPSQEKVIITATNIKRETLAFLASCANNYISNAKTPHLSAYGLNVDFVETENTFLSELFDSALDTQPLIQLDYEIANSQYQRTLIKDDKLVNIQYSQENAQSKIHFNEHHSDPDVESTTFDFEDINGFIIRCKELAIGLGYEFEDDENE